MRRVIILGIILILLVLIVDAISWKIGYIETGRDFLVVTGMAIVGVSTFLAVFVPILENKKSSTSTKLHIETAMQIGNTEIIGSQVIADQIGGTNIEHVEHYYALTVPVQPFTFSNIPDPPCEFVGRQVELEQLLESFREPEPGSSLIKTATISSLSGGAGVGKTALARLLAQKLDKQFDSIRLEINLRGYVLNHEDPLDPYETMRVILAPFYPKHVLPTETRELISYYNNFFRQHKSLLLLDNARDFAQVRDLLPPYPSAAIITSRTHFALPGQLTLRLEVLSLAESRKLLIKIAPRLLNEPERILEKIAHLCGQLPLALRIFGSLLETHKDWSAELMCTRLSDERTRLKVLRDPNDPELDIASVLELSYLNLSPELRNLFRTFGVFPASFTKTAILHLWHEITNADADFVKILSLFVNRCLVDYDAKKDVYILHDLTRIFAEERLCRNPDEAWRVLWCHAMYYFQQGSIIDDLFKQGGTNQLLAITQFSEIWPHLEKDWIRFNDQKSIWPHFPSSDWWSCYMPSAVLNELELYLTIPRCVTYFEVALDAAQRQENVEYQGINLGNLGNYYLFLEQYNRAYDCYKKALEIARQLGNRSFESKALGSLGSFFLQLKNSKRAIKYHRKALIIAYEINDLLELGNHLNNLGLDHWQRHQVEIAIDYYNKALTIAQKIGDLRGEANRLGNLGIAYHQLGNLEKSIKYCEDGLKIDREMGNRLGEGVRLMNLAKIYLEHNDGEIALEYYKQALKAYETILPSDTAWIKAVKNKIDDLILQL